MAVMGVSHPGVYPDTFLMPREFSLNTALAGKGLLIY